MKHLRATVLLVLSCVVATAAEPTFTSTLGSDELSAAGIDGLTPEQIEALNSLAERYKAGKGPDNFGKSARETGASPPRRIETRIVGEFRGWGGGTIFRLENGQLWQQSNPESYRLPKPLTNPPVAIVKSRIGGYVMLVGGCPQLRVKRIE